MSSVAVERLQKRPHLRLVEAAPPQVEPWEVHSELAVVSPEVRTHALEQLPERGPYAFLDFPPPPPAPAIEPVPTLSAGNALAIYVLLRLAQTARLGLALVGALALFAVVSELLR
jgi:hypothetical protein